MISNDAIRQVRASVTTSSIPALKRELVQQTLVPANRGTSGEAEVDETHTGDYGAEDYPFQGNEGDRPFVDEEQAAARALPVWVLAGGGLVAGLLLARLVR